MGLYPNKNVQEYTPRQEDSKLQLPKIKPASEYLAMIKNNQHSGVINPVDLRRANQQLKNFENSRTLDLAWAQLGPDNFGGRTRAIICDNQDATANTIYAAGVSGGVWKSTNLAITWNKVNTQIDNLYVSCMIQTSNGTIYAGTGESFAAESMSGFDDMGYTGGFMGQGIFKSTDGDNFTLLTATEPTYNDVDSDWAYINELAFDNGSGKLYAATNTGLKYSNDNGASWVTVKDTAGTELNMNSYDVQVNSDGVVIACIDNLCYLSQNGNVNNFILRSVDDSISLPSSNVSRIEFAFAPSDPQVAYASVVNQLGNVYNIYRSDDAGFSWRIILPGTQFVPVFLGQGVYDNALTVFPENPDKILLGGFILYQGEMIQAEGLFDWRIVSDWQFSQEAAYLHPDVHTMVFRHGSNNTFFTGTDGGVSKGTVSGNQYAHAPSNRDYYTTQFYAVGNSGLENFNLGGSQDNGSIVISGEGNTPRQGERILGGDGGPCVSSLINHEIVVVSAAGGFILRSEDAGDNYSTQFLSGDITNDQAFITPVALWESFNNPNSRDSVYFHAREEISGGTTIQVRSINDGQPFYYTLPNDITIHNGDSLIVQDVVSSRLFIATSNHIWMTKELHDFGKTPEWFEISDATVGMIGTPQCISYSSDGNHLFVGTQAGRLFRISNLALAYDYERADINSPSCIVSTKEIPLFIPGTSDPVEQVITSIAVDPSDPNNVMVTFGNYGNEYYILFSEDALAEVPEFNSRQGNLPQMPVYSSVIEMTDNSVAVIGTEYGIFVTENIHENTPEWYLEDGEMGKVPVFELKQQIVARAEDEVVLVNGNETIVIPYPGATNYGIVYAATYGRGLMRCNTFRKPVGIDEIIAGENLLKEELILYPNPVNDFVNIECDIIKQGVVNVQVVDLSGKVVSSKQLGVRKGKNKLSVDLSHLAAGTYVMKAVSGNQVFTGKFIAN